MNDHRLSVFDAFRCVAGACPDTCCAGWEIDLDPACLRKLERLPGDLGDEARAALCREGEDVYFGLKNGRCPFLNEENLCRLILGAGEDLLSETCREHPRLWWDFGDLREKVLSVSCPEAARLLLERDPEILETADDAPGDPDPELDRDLLALLLSMREKLLALCLTEAPLTARMAGLLQAARTLDGLLLRWDAGEEISLPEPGPGGDLEMDLAGFLRAVGEMDCTDGRLPALLSESRVPEDFTAFNRRGEAGGRLLYYFLYRYTLRAVWDGWLYEKIAFAVYALGAILTLAERAGLQEAAIRFSREAEHREENLLGLFHWLREEGGYA